MPRLPNPQIALGGGGGSGDGPAGGLFGTLGAMMQIKEHQMALRQRQQDEADDDAIRSTLQHYDRPDDAVQALYHQGFAKAAGTLATQLYTGRKAQLEAAEKQEAGVTRRMEMATQIAQGISDEQSFQNGKSAIHDLLFPIFGPGIDDQLGTNYDPKRMEAVVAYGTKRTDELKRRQDAYANARQAVELQGGTIDPNTQEWIPPAAGQEGGKVAESARKATDFYHNAASRYLSTATNQGEWVQMMKDLHLMGAPDNVLRQFGDWSPDAPKNALQLGLDPDKRITVEHQATQERQAQERIDLDRRRVAEYESRGDAAAAGGAEKPLTQSKISDIREKYHDRLDKLKSAKDDGKITPEQYTERRLEYENAYRTERNWPTLEDAAEQYDAAGNAFKRDEALNIYKQITGKDYQIQGTAPPPATVEGRKELARNLLVQKAQRLKEGKTEEAAKLQKRIDRLLAR